MRKSAAGVLRGPLIVFTTFLFQLLTAAPAPAGPPFRTDDPETLEYRSWQIYFAGQYFRDGDRYSTTLPHVEVDYGVHPDLQLHVLAPLVYAKADDASAQYGYGDTELGVLWRFLDETETRPMIGTFPLLEIPTGSRSRGLGTGEVQAFLPLWLQKEFGELETNGGGGYWINPGEGNRNWWYFGWEVMWEKYKSFALGAEFYYHTAVLENQKDSTGFSVGAIYNLSHDHHILFAVGRDLRGPTELYFYIGYQIDIGRDKKKDIASAGRRFF